MSDIRVRFAPSPTGNVHIGNIRVAIYNWLFARNQGGKFLVRVEDTDRQRSTPEAVETLFDAMTWMGLDYDEEPVYQSKNLDRHKAVAKELVDKDLAYYSDMGDPSRGEALLFKITKDASFDDLVLGTMTKKAEDMKDLVIMKSDGTPTFHLANIIDDIDMGITHVLRGNDHVENTYRHILIYEALGAERPTFAHLPMIVNAKGAPYSKRDGDAYVGDYRSKGYLPEVLFNFLALCGWSPGDDREILNIDEMKAEFDVKRVKKTAAQFNLEKFEWMNQQYIKNMDDATLTAYLNPFMQEDGVDLTARSTAWLAMFFGEYKERIRSVAQFKIDTRYLFHDVTEYTPKAWRKFIEKDGVSTVLADIKALLEATAFEVDPLHDALNNYVKEKELGFGKVAQPIRVALTGDSFSPGLSETLILVGKENALARIQAVIDKLAVAQSS